MTEVKSPCPSCGEVASRHVYDIGSGPEVCCSNCDWCWSATGGLLKRLTPTSLGVQEFVVGFTKEDPVISVAFDESLDRSFTVDVLSSFLNRAQAAQGAMNAMGVGVPDPEARLTPEVVHGAVQAINDEVDKNSRATRWTMASYEQKGDADHYHDRPKPMIARMMALADEEHAALVEEMAYRHAIRVIAHHIVQNETPDEMNWEGRSDIADKDWTAILAEIDRIISAPNPDDYDMARDYLRGRR